MCYFEFTRLLRRVNGVFLPISFILIGRLLNFFFFWGGGCKPTTNGCFLGGEGGA